MLLKASRQSGALCPLPALPEINWRTPGINQNFADHEDHRYHLTRSLSYSKRQRAHSKSDTVT